MIPSRGRARLGVLVPFTNTNLEPDLAMMAPPGMSIHIARMGGYDADETPDEHQMKGLGSAGLDEPLSLLLGAQPDVILYGCTSATLTHGPDFDRALAKRIHDVCGARTVTAAGALVSALRHIGAAQVGFASPYVPAINDMAVDFLTTEGIEVVARSEVTARLSNEGQGAMTPEAVLALGAAADFQDAEALVLSCTDMRSVEIISQLEEAAGKPVITSNQASLFAALQHLKIDDPIPGFGQLLKMPRL